MASDAVSQMSAIVDARTDHLRRQLLAGAIFPLNLSDEFASLADLRGDEPISIVASHSKSGPHTFEALTFKRCQELADHYARGLREHGVRRGDTAVILMKPTLEFVPIFLALWKVGAIPVTVDPGAPKQQKLKSIEDIGPKLLVGIPIAHALRLLYPKVFRTITHAVTVGKRGIPGAPSFRSFIRKEEKSRPFQSEAVMSDDPMAIVFTSGSTGPPKGVVYTQANGAAIIQAMKEALGIGPDEVCLACHPAFALYFVGAGATVISPDMDPRYPRDADPSCLLAIIRDRKPTTAFMQIPVIRNLVQYCAARGEKIPYLRRILTTGATVPPPMVESVHAVLAEPDADLHIMYGATEALCISYATGREVLARAARSIEGAGTYLGRPSPWVQVRIIAISAEPIPRWSDDLILASGQIGEVCVAGPVVTPEYQGRPEATAKAKIQSETGIWHRTGDAGYLDGDGGLWYCGRISDRVITARGDMYSDLVEPVFNRYPGVGRSALVGVAIPGSPNRRPVILVEPADRTLDPDSPAGIQLAEELRLLSSRHPQTEAVEDVLIQKEAFPVDVRHGAKIRRDLLARSIAPDVTGKKDVPGKKTDQLPADRTVLFRNHRVAYYEKGSGEPFLFLHNAGTDHYIWEHQLEHFSRSKRVIGVDNLGYGASDCPEVEYTLPLYTEMVSTIVDTLALAPVTIVATCTGAAMALNFTLKNPDKVKRLILFHIATEKTVKGGNLERTTKMVSGKPLMKRIVGAATEAMMRRGILHRAVIQGQYAAGFQEDPAFIDHLHDLYSRKGKGHCVINLFSNWDSFAALDGVTWPAGFPPLHILWGSENEVIPLARGRELCEKLRPRSFDIIEGGAHLVMREKPREVIRKIEELAGL